MSVASLGGEPLTAAFCERPAEEVARDLLGRVLVSTVGGERTAGRIVEAEAYVGPHDEASHAAARIGATARNRPMFGPPGTAYVYRIYGVHWCLNVVTDRVGYAAAVLIRALEPLVGFQTMLRRRGLAGSAAGPRGESGRRVGSASGSAAAAAPARDVAAAYGRRLAGGPGRLAAALGVTGDLNGHHLTEPPLVLLPGRPVDPRRVEVGPRIGVTRAADWPLRFFVRDNPCVSRG